MVGKGKFSQVMEMFPVLIVGYRGVHICQNSSNCTLNICALHYMLILHPHKKGNVF